MKAGETVIGLERGKVALLDHEKAWEKEAENTILKLRSVLGDTIKDISHVGSTSVPSIKAKSIIDIAVAVESFDEILKYENELRKAGFYYRPQNGDGLENQLLFACGSFYDGTGSLQTHFIHVVICRSKEWTDYINFRDYLKANHAVAKEYEALKIASAEKYENDRNKYVESKHAFIASVLEKSY